MDECPIVHDFLLWSQRNKRLDFIYLITLDIEIDGKNEITHFPIGHNEYRQGKYQINTVNRSRWYKIRYTPSTSASCRSTWRCCAYSFFPSPTIYRFRGTPTGLQCGSSWMGSWIQLELTLSTPRLGQGSSSHLSHTAVVA